MWPIISKASSAWPQFADHGLAGGLLAVQAVEHRGELGRHLSQAREQQFALPGVVQLLRAPVDVEEHRAQHREVGQRLQAPGFGPHH
jgi:hypothetical protein